MVQYTGKIEIMKYPISLGELSSRQEILSEVNLETVEDMEKKSDDAASKFHNIIGGYK